MAEVIYNIIQNKDQKIIVRKFKGEVCVEEIIQSFEHMHEQMLDSHVIGIVSDFEDSDMKVNLTSLQEVIKYLKETSEYHSIKLAVLVNSPYKVVFPLMASAKVKEAIIKPFSTQKAAIDWILN